MSNSQMRKKTNKKGSVMNGTFSTSTPFSCMGNHLRVWATVFMRGRPSSCVVVVSVHGRSFPCVGGQLELMRGWLLALVGSLLRMGLLSCRVVVLWFSWDDSGRVGGAYYVEEQQWMTNFHSSFVIQLPRHGQWCGNHAPCASLVCWGCCGCVEHALAGMVFGDGWWEQEQAGDTCGWWWLRGKVVGLGFGQNSHSQKLPISFLGRRLHGWYLGHKISIYVKAFVV